MSKQTPASQPAFAPLSADGGDQVIFATVDAAVSTAAQAQWAFQDQSLEMRRAVIKAMRKTSIANAERWGRMAVEETKMGRVADKAHKNLLCATRTPGVEDLQSRAYTGDKGLTLVEYAPFGVVAAITPSNNPAATVISKAWRQNKLTRFIYRGLGGYADGGHDREDRCKISFARAIYG